MESAAAAGRSPVHRIAGIAIPPDLEAASPSARSEPLLNGEEPAVLDIDFRAMVERIPAITYAAGFGESGRWHYLSEQVRSMLGFTPEEWRADPDL
jgi:hypothetical protein